MPIIPNFTPADIERQFNKLFEVVEKRLIDRLKQLGEMCVKQARESAPPYSYLDQTGNLRSSIGYMVFKEGVAIHEIFEQVKGGTEGVKTAQAVARKIGGSSKGLTLVVVAGMNYAVYVEAKGFDVLASAEHLAEKELPRMLAELKENIREALT